MDVLYTHVSVCTVLVQSVITNCNESTWFWLFLSITFQTKHLHCKYYELFLELMTLSLRICFCTGKRVSTPSEGTLFSYTKKVCFFFTFRKIYVHNMILTCSDHGIFMYCTCNSMNNLLSYGGLVEASASEKFYL